MIHIYTGDGKGKTTAALGLALRAHGAGYAVVLAQFLKTMPTSELAVIGAWENACVIRSRKEYGFTWELSDEERQMLCAEQDALLQQAIAACPTAGPVLLVLDEAVGACTYGYLQKEALLAFLRKLPERMEVVLTGRDPIPELLELADYVSEICKVRHPFDRGVASRVGIEE